MIFVYISMASNRYVIVNPSLHFLFRPFNIIFCFNENSSSTNPFNQSSILIEAFILIHVEVWVLGIGWQLKIKNDVRKRKEEKYFAYTRELIQRREENATLIAIQREGRSIFSFCRVFTYWFLEILLRYDHRYSVEISTASGVIGHTDSEYEIRKGSWHPIP